MPQALPECHCGFAFAPRIIKVNPLFPNHNSMTADFPSVATKLTERERQLTKLNP